MRSPTTHRARAATLLLPCLVMLAIACARHPTRQQRVCAPLRPPRAARPALLFRPPPHASPPPTLQWRGVAPRRVASVSGRAYRRVRAASLPALAQLERDALPIRSHLRRSRFV